jgi:hypothetical protein
MEAESGAIYFDKYSVEGLLGEGSYGKVKLARDITTSESVFSLPIISNRSPSKSYRKRV